MIKLIPAFRATGRCVRGGTTALPSLSAANARFMASMACFIGSANAQLVPAGFSQPFECPAAPGVLAQRRLEAGVRPVRARVDADLDANHALPAGPGPALERGRPGCQKPAARQEIRNPGRYHQGSNADQVDWLAGVRVHALERDVTGVTKSSW